MNRPGLYRTRGDDIRHPGLSVSRVKSSICVYRCTQAQITKCELGGFEKTYVRRVRVVRFLEMGPGGKEENPKPRQLPLLGHQPKAQRRFGTASAFPFDPPFTSPLLAQQATRKPALCR